MAVTLVMPHSKYGQPGKVIRDTDWVESELVKGGYAVRGVRRQAAPGYAQQTVDELQAELRKRGLSVEGLKAELVTRLEENDASK